jgi:hypothetical protein
MTDLDAGAGGRQLAPLLGPGAGAGAAQQQRVGGQRGEAPPLGHSLSSSVAVGVCLRAHASRAGGPTCS